MKKILFLTILSCLAPVFHANAVDVFALPTNERTIYERGFPLNEYLIYTQDEKCFLHYLSTTPPTQYIQIAKYPEVKNVQCLEKGFASVNIMDENNNPVRTLTGYFLNGFFIGSVPLNTYAIKRSAESNGTQNLFYFIDQDDNLKVQYIGKMHARIDDGVYLAFDACNPFEILMQTQNKSLFDDQTTIQNLFTVVKSYAQTICPNVNRIVFKATDSPSLDKSGTFFQKTYQKDFTTGNWEEDQVSFDEIVEFSENLPSVIDVPAPAPNSKETTAKSPELIIHISDKTNQKVLFVDEPYLMKAIQNDYTLNLKSGCYYRVKAKLTPMEDLEKKRTGISLNEKADIIDITSATLCKDSTCR